MTIKDVTFLGPRDEFVAGGSEEGLLMIWERRSGRLVNVLEGDRRAVNGVRGHPHLPLLASYGIDRTVKARQHLFLLLLEYFRSDIEQLSSADLVALCTIPTTPSDHGSNGRAGVHQVVSLPPRGPRL